MDVYLRWKGSGRHRRWHSTSRPVPQSARDSSRTCSSRDTPWSLLHVSHFALGGPAGKWKELDPLELDWWPSWSSRSGISVSREQTSHLQLPVPSSCSVCGFVKYLQNVTSNELFKQTRQLNLFDCLPFKLPVFLNLTEYQYRRPLKCAIGRALRGNELRISLFYLFIYLFFLENAKPTGGD